MLISLSELKPGDYGRVVGFNPGNLAYRQKLLAMGLTPHTRFEVIRRAPLGDPIEIKVRKYHLSLRQLEAALLNIERVYL